MRLMAHLLHFVQPCTWTLNRQQTAHTVKDHTKEGGNQQETKYATTQSREPASSDSSLSNIAGYEPLPEFLANIGYPELPHQSRPQTPEDMYDNETFPYNLEDNNEVRVPRSHQPDYKKWPFPSMQMDNKVGLIYDAVCTTGHHNHMTARIQLQTNLQHDVCVGEATGH